MYLNDTAVSCILTAISPMTVGVAVGGGNSVPLRSVEMNIISGILPDCLVRTSVSIFTVFVSFGHVSPSDCSCSPADICSYIRHNRSVLVCEYLSQHTSDAYVSNIPPMVTILRSEGIIVESVSPSIITSSEVECISVHGIFPYLDVLASCWFGSIRTFLQIRSSSLASCEVPDGIVGNISVTITEESNTQFLSRHFFILVLKQMVVSLHPSLTAESVGHLIIVEGLHPGYTVQTYGNVSRSELATCQFPDLSSGSVTLSISNDGSVFSDSSLAIVIKDCSEDPNCLIDPSMVLSTCVTGS